MSRFKPAENQNTFVKALFFGESGSGKTFTSLSSFPKPAIIDNEKGCIHYAKCMKEEYNNPFVKLDIIDFNDLFNTVIDIRRDPQIAFEGLPFMPATLIIDSLTPFYNNLVRKCKKHFPAQKDSWKMWDVVKEKWETMLRNLIQMNMNVVCTARAKSLKSPDGAITGSTFDAEKSTDYIFDTTLNFFKGSKRLPKGDIVSVNMFNVSKDRLRVFKQFANYEITPNIFIDSFGPVTSKGPSKDLISSNDIEVINELITELGIDLNEVSGRLEKTYGVQSVSELKIADAKDIMKKLNAAKKAKDDAAAKKDAGVNAGVEVDGKTAGNDKAVKAKKTKKK